MNEPYIQALANAIREMHGCASTHLGSVPVKETFQGGTVWHGVVEVFRLEGHSSAEKCYAWGYREKGKMEYVAVLAVPPVNDTYLAVRAFIIAKQKKNDPLRPAWSKIFNRFSNWDTTQDFGKYRIGCMLPRDHLNLTDFDSLPTLCAPKSTCIVRLQE